MKHRYAIAILALFVMIGSLNIVQAQAHIDPPFLQVVSAENPITVDGILDETDWLRRFDYLVFRQGYEGGDVQYGVTQFLDVDSVNTDSTTTYVKILHYGLDLYISIDSDDKYVNKWGGSWEGDGLFMKIADASGAMKEYKLYFNAAGIDPDIVFESASVGSGEAMAFKKAGTIVNDTSQVDAGYTAELVIHLDSLGYTDPYSEIEVLMNIFDPDGQTGAAGEEWAIGTYSKSWWGSEWGPDSRILRLADPPMKNAITTSEAFVLDGQLNEGFWTDAESVEVGKGNSASTGGYYAQWSNPSNTYDDQSNAKVKFAHNGTDLYIGVESDDKSVCSWSPGWEADGLFLWITNKGEDAPAARMEIKNMFFGSTEGALAEFQLSGSVPTGGAEGASFVPAGTVTHSEVAGPDAGYSLEVVVHTDFFGYSDGDEVNLSVVIWDLDYGDAAAFTDSTSDYAPNWWGTQWVDPNFEKYYMYRKVKLSDISVDVNSFETLPVLYQLDQNYPNPFNPTTKISYSIAKKEFVSLKVYDILGNEITTLINSIQDNGVHEISFDASNLSTGVYFYTLKSGNNIQTRKMLLMK